MKSYNLIESFNAAIEGLIYVFKSQRNMRLHFLLALFAILMAIFLNFTYIELILLSITIAFVLFAEMFNTAIEYTIDMIGEGYHPLGRIVKDISAGAVLLSSIAALIVGYILFISRTKLDIEENLIKIKHTPWHITFIILNIILIIVILTKLLLHKGTPLRGGMPSGHSAISFSIWAIISLLYPNSLIVFLVFILAFLVARGRVRSGIHTTLEVFWGGLIGVVFTILIFQLLWR